MKREKILKQMQVPCTSKKGHFVKTDRLLVIDDLLYSSEYQKIHQGNLSVIYGKVPLSEMDVNSPVYLISTHVDTVPDRLSCVIDKERKSLRGTFDNTITNAAAVSLMTESRLPGNVIFAFNGDEETGRCGGAREAVKALTAAGYSLSNIRPVALDVTYEGFYRKMLYTIENIEDGELAVHAVNVAHAMDSIEAGKLGRDVHTFCYAAPGGIRRPGNLSPAEFSAQCSWLDEGQIYNRLGTKAMSFCIPCGNGEMHSSRGVEVETPVYHGYIDSLENFIMIYAYGAVPERNRCDYLSDLEAMEETRIAEWKKEAEDRRTREIWIDDKYHTANSRVMYDEDFGHYYETYEQQTMADYFGSEDTSSLSLIDNDFWDYVSSAMQSYEADQLSRFLRDIEIPEEVLLIYGTRDQVRELLQEAFLFELGYDSIEEYRMDYPEDSHSGEMDDRMDSMDYSGLY